MTDAHAQNLAREFLDLWQKQVARALTDKDYVAAMLGMMQQLQKAGAGHDFAGFRPAAAHPAAAPVADDDQLARLTLRLAVCEQRLSELEAAQARRKTAAAGGSRKRPAKRAKPARPRVS